MLSVDPGDRRVVVGVGVLADGRRALLVPGRAEDPVVVGPGVAVVPALVTGVSDLSEASGAHPCHGSPFSIALYPGSANRAAIKAFALDIVQRYRDRQEILFWELGNELNLAAKERNPGLLCVTRVKSDRVSASDHVRGP